MESSRCSSTQSTTGCLPRSSSSTPAEVEKCPLAVLLPRSGGSRPRRVKRISDSCWVELILKGLPTESKTCFSMAARRLCKVHGKVGEERQVEQHSGHFHPGQDGHQRHLDIVQKRETLAAFHLRAQDGDEAQGGLSVRRGVSGRGLDRHIRHADLLAAGADQRLDMRHLFAQPHRREVLQSQVTRGRVHEELGDHRIKSDGRRPGRRSVLTRCSHTWHCGPSWQCSGR